MLKKATFLIVVVIVLGLIIWACDGGSVLQSSFTIKVTGTDGLKYSGSYMTVMADGKNSSKSVDGTVPGEYTVDASMVSVTFQKQSESGALKVEILKDGEVVAENETEAAYGVVTAATQ